MKNGTKSLRTITAGEYTVTFELERKAVKNINLRVKQDGSVHVSANSRTPLRAIDGFVKEKSAFILTAQEKFACRPPVQQFRCADGETVRLEGQKLTLRVERAGSESVTEQDDILRICLRDPADETRGEKLLQKWIDSRCRTVFTEVLQELYPIFAEMGVAEPKLRIRTMRSRWGSCHVRDGIITLNRRLIEAPRICIVYVAMHEYCHFLHPDHGKGFHALLGTLMPEWKTYKKILENSVSC